MKSTERVIAKEYSLIYFYGIMNEYIIAVSNAEDKGEIRWKFRVQNRSEALIKPFRK